MRLRSTILFCVAAASILLVFAAIANASSRAVIITPHVDAIRHEFGNGFARWHSEKFSQPAEVEWRVVGGTSDALRFVLSEFSRKPDGIGLDIFFGGGQEPFLVLADKKLSLAHKPPPEILDGIPRQVSGMDVYDSNHT